jgi:multidrug resistance efflux pump
MLFVHPKIRDDLQYHREEKDGDVVIYVKDPIRLQFYRFNELQVEMLKLLDGKRTFAEIAEILSVQFENEVPPAQVQRFTSKLEGMLLLDVSSYTLSTEEARKNVRKELRRRNLVWRGIARSDSPAESPEAILFRMGIEQIEHGDPCHAARHFSALLEIDPGNERVREILIAIHAAYFESLKGTPSHMLRLWSTNPDRFMGVLDKYLGNFVFSRWGLLTMLAVFAIAAPCFADVVWFPPLSYFSWWDIFWELGPLQVMIMFVHECGHGFATKHYGGKVNDCGVMAMYGILPSAYCDTSESYLFRDRTAMVMVQLAGTLAQFFYTAILILIYYITSDDFPFRKAIFGSFLLSIFTSYQNWIPLVKLDGYYALADYLQIVNLRERSLRHIFDWLKKYVLGIEVKPLPSTPRERRIFLIFGIASMLYTPLFILFACLVMFPLTIRIMSGIGVVLVCWSIYQLIIYPLIYSGVDLGRLLWTNRKQVFTPARSAVFALIILAVTGVLSIRWPILVDGQLYVQPAQRASAAAGEGGIVEEILVREGTVVTAGQVVARLRDDELLRQREDVQIQLDVAKLRLQLLLRGARREEISAAMARVRTAGTAKRFADQHYELTRSMTAVNLRAKDAELTAGHARVEAADEEQLAISAVDLLRAGTRIEDVQQAQAKLRQLEARRAELDLRIERLAVKSPIDGVVVTPHIDWLHHKKLAPGEAFCSVQTVDHVYGEVWLDLEQPLERLKVGDRVRMTTYGEEPSIQPAEVQRVRLAKKGDRPFMVVETNRFENPGWVAGAGGRARIYCSKRSIGYLLLLPVLQILDYKAWAHVA